MEFDVAARAVLRGGVSSQRMSSKLVSEPLQRQISDQIAAAAVYANQTSPLISEDARPLGPIFPRVGDMDSTEESDAALETKSVSQPEGTPVNFYFSGKKKPKKRGGSGRQD